LCAAQQKAPAGAGPKTGPITARITANNRTNNRRITGRITGRVAPVPPHQAFDSIGDSGTRKISQKKIRRRESIA
jgi:hypothetical protein